jgi:predicted GNAT family acetyltransferase
VSTIDWGAWKPFHPEFSWTDYGESLDTATQECVASVRAAARVDSGTPRRSDVALLIEKRANVQAYAAWLNCVQIGHLDYKLLGYVVVMLSTKVDPRYRRQSVATELIQCALDDVRSTARKIAIVCPAVRVFVDLYPQYADLMIDGLM